jgi:hypothetical protein|tara:strand:+ start:1141 stop:1317 length:177 start_codon:yes stop_codon:yes gene_type:complete
MHYQVIYTPRVMDEIVVASFPTYKEADKHLAKIKTRSSKAYAHHYIRMNDIEVQAVDS